MLDDYVDHFHAMIDQNIQLFLRALRRMIAGKNFSMTKFECVRQAIPTRRGKNFRSCSAKDGDILDDALPADVKVLGQLAAAHRGTMPLHPGQNAAAPVFARVVRQRRWRRRAPRWPRGGQHHASQLSCQLTRQMTSIAKEWAKSESLAMNSLGENFAKAFVGGAEFFGFSTGFADHRHETGVARPARQDVQMQMAGYAGARRPAQIHTN